MLSEPLQVVARLARALDRLAIPYVVGGSLASSIYGIPRATQDVDLVAEIELLHVETLINALASEALSSGPTGHHSTGCCDHARSARTLAADRPAVHTQ